MPPMVPPSTRPLLSAGEQRCTAHHPGQCQGARAVQVGMPDLRIVGEQSGRPDRANPGASA
jgi:hypothetical protein